MKTVKIRVKDDRVEYADHPLRIPSNTLNYITASFDIQGDDWSACDSIKAVFRSDYALKAVPLDSEGTCMVPNEMLDHVSKVWVNLVGLISDNDDEDEETVTMQRITTEPIVALTVYAKAFLGDGEE